MTRTDLFRTICQLAQPGTSIVDPKLGWPGIADVLLPEGTQVRVALHVSQVSSHSRKPYERRFQNPADSRPVDGSAGLPILVGLAKIDGRPIMVALNGASRVDRNARFSILFNDSVMKRAAVSGWDMYQSSTGERIFAFTPTLFPMYVALLRAGLEEDFSQPINSSIQVAISGSGLIEDGSAASAERARRAVTVLIRGSAFGGAVVKAYSSLCSMCGLNTGLVVGAHIFPVEAPNSPDEVWNGLALCHNHHAAFDQHKIWVSPGSRTIHYRPDITRQGRSQAALRAFITNTFDELAQPSSENDLPREAMFQARYDFYSGKYDWI